MTSHCGSDNDDDDYVPEEPKPEATALSEEELATITARTVRGATSNTTSQDRVVLLTEVRRLRAENASLRKELSRTKSLILKAWMSEDLKWLSEVAEEYIRE